MTSSLHFLKAVFKAPLQTATLFQSSPLLVNQLVSPLALDNHCSVLELGVGAGAVTQKVNQLIKSKDKYLGVEINEELYNFVRAKFKDFHFVCASAEVVSDYSQKQKFDVIISTLPWSLFDTQRQQNILEQVKIHLEKGGYFKTYLFSNALLTKSGRRFQKLLNEKFIVEENWELLNIPPAKVFECRLKI